MTSKKPDPATPRANRPLIDPLSDSLAVFSDADRAAAMERFRVLQPHLEIGVPLTAVAEASGHPVRTLRRWAAQYREAGLAGLVRRRRTDAGRQKLHSDLALQIEALALQKPRLSAASIQRRIAEAAKAEGRPTPSYATVRRVMDGLDPAMLCLVHDGPTTYRDRYELIHRHRAEQPNAVWQADHTQLDLLILDANGKPARPWLTIVQDDYSRAVAGYCVFLGAPSALQTSLALRQAIWRKTDPDWPVCGIPGTLYTDHGSDFTSQHLEQVAAELRIELVFSAVARPQGRGKIERIFGTVNRPHRKVCT
jgi:putative transposase